jgi:hypothetical protein
MTGFLSYIASQYRRKPEDVATDVVAYLMQAREVRERISGCLKGLGFPNLSPDFKVQLRFSSPENGTPDLRLIDRQDKCRAIIENKFGALLTDKQPCAYLKEIPADGLLLFVVPRWRLVSVWNQIKQRCETEYGPMTRITDVRPGFIGRTGSKCMAIIPWDRFLKILSSSGVSKGSYGDETEIFVQQLRRLCDVEKPKFENLKAHAKLLTRTETASAVYACVPLVDMLLSEVEDAGYFEPKLKRKHDKCGRGYFGEYGQLGSFRAWIGFDARVWSQKGKSPIWIEFYDTHEIDGQLRDIFRSARGKWPWLADLSQLEDENNGNHQLVIPILLKSGVEYDVLLRAAVERIEQVAKLLKLRRKTMVRAPGA